MSQMKDRLIKKRSQILNVLVLMFFLLNVTLLFVSPLVALIPFIMLPIMLLSTVKWSRGFCGWACPRAAFQEKILKYISLKRKVPEVMRKPWFSILVFIVLISRVVYVGFAQGILAAGFLLCIVPTVIAIVVGLYSPKAWCTFCPSGSMLKVLNRGVLRITKTNCNNCGVCDKSCPMGVSISSIPQNGFVNDPTCTQCGLCVSSCPFDYLKFEKRKANKQTSEFKFSA